MTSLITPDRPRPDPSRAAPAAALSDPAPFVALRGLTKRFPGVVANDAIDLAILPGEVHVLLGENGAGKSTLVSILSGLVQPDAGQVLVEGRPVRIGSPRQALALGIGTVFQHMMLVPTLTVAENLELGGPWWQRPRTAVLAARVAEIAARLGLSVNLDARIADLSLGQQQQVEILRALLRDSRLLILDESTSMLTPQGIEELGALMRRLVAQGIAIVFITHKLNEAAAFGDRISVLRLGRKVGEIAPDRLRALSRDDLVAEIVRLMFDRDTDESAESFRRTAPLPAAAPEVLAVEGLAIAPTADTPGLRDVSLRVRAGEILGIAGIDGNGQKDLAEALAGQRPVDAGRVRLGDRPLDGLSVGERRGLGLRYLTDDRLGEGTVGAFPVSLNYVAKEIGAAPLWVAGFERRGAIARHATDLTGRYDVRTPSIRTPVGRLSGGNIQKVLLAREMAEGARAVIFNKPTYGLDLANTQATRRRIREIADGGLAVLLISTDLDELLAICDRIAVMADGRLIGTVDNDAAAAPRIGRMMLGVAA
jgi:simple sugar transport system ATP-binding protein